MVYMQTNLHIQRYAKEGDAHSSLGSNRSAFILYLVFWSACLHGDLSCFSMLWLACDQLVKQ